MGTRTTTALAAVPTPQRPPRVRRKTPKERAADRMAIDGAIVAWLERYSREHPIIAPDDWMAVAHTARDLVHLLAIAETNAVDLADLYVQRDLLAVIGACERLRQRGAAAYAALVAGGSVPA